VSSAGHNPEDRDRTSHGVNPRMRCGLIMAVRLTT
jgi:hypothetical protein